MSKSRFEWSIFHLLYKVFSTGQPSYIYELLPPLRSSRRHANSFNLFTCKSEYFKSSFIPNVIYQWNKLDPDNRSSFSSNLFRNTLGLLGLLRERRSILMIQ